MDFEQKDTKVRKPSTYGEIAVVGDSPFGGFGRCLELVVFVFYVTLPAALFKFIPVFRIILKDGDVCGVEVQTYRVMS